MLPTSLHQPLQVGEGLLKLLIVLSQLMLDAAFGGQTSVAGAGIGGKSVDVKDQQRRAAPGQWEWRDGARQVLERYPWLAHATNAFVDSRFSGRGAVRLGYFLSFESDSGISFRKTTRI